MTGHTARDHDIVVFGATGFVGRLVATALVEAAPPTVRVALAGRSRERLADLRGRLGARAADWPLLVVDATDPQALREMAGAAAVVASTVGPYAAHHGLSVVDACVRAGTDYVDLTGETLFVRDSIDAHHDGARAAGARIVHSCGFDSVPSDLGVMLAARAATDDGAPLSWAILALRSAAGGISGGTIESLRVHLDEVTASPARRRLAGDPFALSPDHGAEPRPGRQPDMAGPRWDDRVGAWTAPFVMAPHNTRIVRRSNALLGWAYGRDLRYREVVAVGDGWAGAAKAAGMTIGLAALFGAMRVRPSRVVLDRLLPDPGEGPDAQTRADGHFAFDLHAGTARGARYRGRVAAQGDPGYAATSVMMAHSALALVLDRPRLPDIAGVLTPATGIGAVLVDRLRGAGFEIHVERSASRA